MATEPSEAELDERLTRLETMTGEISELVDQLARRVLSPESYQALVARRQS